MGKTVVGASTVKTIISKLNAGKPIVMFYHMNGCGHCEAMMPAWNASVAKYKGVGVIAQVEMSNMQHLPVFMQNVRGFPTLVMYRVGSLPVEYLGDRSESSIAEFIAQNLTAQPKAKPKFKPKLKTKPKNPLKK